MAQNWEATCESIDANFNSKKKLDDDDGLSLLAQGRHGQRAPNTMMMVGVSWRKANDGKGRQKRSYLMKRDDYHKKVGIKTCKPNIVKSIKGNGDGWCIGPDLIMRDMR